jgi:hypothetical protein
MKSSIEEFKKGAEEMKTALESCKELLESGKVKEHGDTCAEAGLSDV